MSEVEAMKVPHPDGIPDLGNALPRSTPELNGINSSAITGFLEAVQNEQLVNSGDLDMNPTEGLAPLDNFA